MTSSFLTCLMVHSLLFFGLLLLAEPDQLSARPLPTNDIVGDECKQTKNATTCQEIVKAYHYIEDLVPYASLNTARPITTPQGPSRLTVPYAYSVSNETYHYIEDLVHHTKNPALNATYDNCLSFYDAAVGATEQAGEYLLKRDYNTVVVMASGARNLSEDCADVLTGNDGDGGYWTMPHDPSQLLQKTNYFTVVADFLGQVAYDLKQQ